MTETIILVLFAGTIFLMAFVSSRPRDARGAAIWRRIGQWLGPLVLAWVVGKELLGFLR